MMAITDHGLLDEWRESARHRQPGLDGLWPDPACGDLVRAIETGEELHAPLRSLGRARQAHGFSLGEAITDLGALAALELAARVDSVENVAVLAEAWSEDDARSEPGPIDQLTGLPNLAWLRTRVDELYDSWRVGVVPRVNTLVLVADIADPQRSVVDELASRVLMGHVVSRQFAGLPRAMSDSLAVVVLPAEHARHAAIDRLSGMRGVRLRQVPLPPTIEGFDELIGRAIRLAR